MKMNFLVIQLSDNRKAQSIVLIIYIESEFLYISSIWSTVYTIEVMDKVRNDNLQEMDQIP